MSESKPPIVITGFMGAGKTTIAAALARLSGRRMIDLDSLIEEREGRSAQQIIDAEGEGPFREIESATLVYALESGGALVIALGGGAWTIERNRELVSSHQCFTIWLDAPFELCWKRIGYENGLRPLARDPESARRLYEARRALYASAALHVEVSEDKSPEAIAMEIAGALSEEGDLTRKGKV